MKQFVLIVAAAVIFSISSLIPTVSSERVVCYFASWTVYRHGNGKFDVDDIDPSLCTHVNFAFIGLNENATIFIIDPWESDDSGKYRGFHRIIELKNQNPQLKVMVSMGGWNEGAEKYSKLAANSTLRKTLAQNVLTFVEEKKFDGFDLDWEYPGSREGSQPDIDKEDFVALLTEFSVLLKPRGLLLSAAVAGGVDRINLGFDVPKVSELLDMINVMVYDFHGHFESFVGHGSPLHASSLDYLHGRNASLTVATGIEYWLYKGADPAKINLGIASYGRAFTLADPKNTQLYAPTLGGGNPGPYTNQSGFLGYNEICEFHSDWTYVWDDEQKVPHRVGDTDQWVGFEDNKSLSYKVEFALGKKLGGFMMWALDTDDFMGICGLRYPLLRSVQHHVAAYKNKTTNN